MTMREVIRKLTEESNVWSQNKVAMELGMLPQAMANRMKPERDMKVGFAVSVLRVLGYRVVVVPPGVKLPQGSIVVDE